MSLSFLVLLEISSFVFFFFLGIFSYYILLLTKKKKKHFNSATLWLRTKNLGNVEHITRLDRFWFNKRILIDHFFFFLFYWNSPGSRIIILYYTFLFFYYFFVKYYYYYYLLRKFPNIQFTFLINLKTWYLKETISW